jgi:hypothetical protein
MNRWNLICNLIGSIRLAEGFTSRHTRALRQATDTSEIFTDIVIREHPNIRFMNFGHFMIHFHVRAATQTESARIGRDYTTQLCNLLALVTGVGVYHDFTDADRRAMLRQSLCQPVAQRILMPAEWQWILNHLPHLQLRAPGFLTACGWYRQALRNDDPAQRIRCLWMAIESCAACCNPDPIAETDTTPSRAAIAAFLNDRFDQPPGLLADERLWRRIRRLANDIADGDKPVGRHRIDALDEHLDNLRDTAHRVLQHINNHICSQHSLMKPPLSCFPVSH